MPRERREFKSFAALCNSRHYLRLNIALFMFVYYQDAPQWIWIWNIFWYIKITAILNSAFYRSYY